MKKVLLALLVGVAVFFIIALGQSLIRNVAFTEALSRSYNFFLGGIAAAGTYAALYKKGKNEGKDDQDK